MHQPPFEKRRILVDASSAILMTKAGLMEELIMAYRVACASSVYRELCRKGYPGAKEISVFRQTGKIRVTEGPGDSPGGGRPPIPAGLGPGERDTIRHFYGGAGAFIIIDDGRGARYCRNAGIPFINALLVPKLFYFAGRLSEEAYLSATATVIGEGRYAATILSWAQACSQKDLSFFLPEDPSP